MIQCLDTALLQVRPSNPTERVDVYCDSSDMKPEQALQVGQKYTRTKERNTLHIMFTLHDIYLFRACCCTPPLLSPKVKQTQSIVLKMAILQVRPSHPAERVDVYCDSSPTPGPSPADHTWSMSAGGATGPDLVRLRTQSYTSTFGRSARAWTV